MPEVTSFESRYNLGSYLGNELKNLFDDEIEIIPFGSEFLTKDNPSLLSYLNSMEVNKSKSGMLIKFAPDYILLTKNPQNLYFLEIKTSVTPLYSQSRYNEIKSKHNAIKLSDIGVIAREAWNSYKSFYPNTIIIAAATYNPKLLMAEFVDNIECLRCYSDNDAYDCTKCPIKENELFPIQRNFRSFGSQTPQTNLNYSSFKDFATFFHGIGIKTNSENIANFKSKLKSIGIAFPNKAYESTKDITKSILRKEGCDWIK